MPASTAPAPVMAIVDASRIVTSWENGLFYMSIEQDIEGRNCLGTHSFIVISPCITFIYLPRWSSVKNLSYLLTAVSPCEPPVLLRFLWCLWNNSCSRRCNLHVWNCFILLQHHVSMKCLYIYSILFYSHPISSIFISAIYHFWSMMHYMLYKL